MRISRNKPYQHLIFQQILRDYVSDCKLLTNCQSSKFLVQWQGEQHEEIPKALLALAATAVCFT
jgi:hypothetical protein